VDNALGTFHFDKQPVQNKLFILSNMYSTDRLHSWYFGNPKLISLALC